MRPGGRALSSSRRAATPCSFEKDTPRVGFEVRKDSHILKKVSGRGGFALTRVCMETHGMGGAVPFVWRRFGLSTRSCPGLLAGIPMEASGVFEAHVTWQVEVLETV